MAGFQIVLEARFPKHDKQETIEIICNPFKAVSQEPNGFSKRTLWFDKVDSKQLAA